MSKTIKSSPVVIYLKTGLSQIKRTVPSSGKKRGPEPCHYGSREEGPPAIRKEVDPESIQSARLSALGNRLRVDQEKGFFLDGRPADLDTVMKETNRVRKANGLEPVGRNPRWFA